MCKQNAHFDIEKMTKYVKKRAKSAFSNTLLGRHFSAVLYTGAPLSRWAELRCIQFHQNCENNAQFLSEIARNVLEKSRLIAENTA